MLNRATEEGFRSWLTYKEGSEVVGYANHTQNCPLVNYYKYLNPQCDKIGILGGTLYYGNAEYLWENETASLASWEYEFVCRIDKGITGIDTVANAQQALVVLDGKRLIEL